MRRSPPRPAAHVPRHRHWILNLRDLLPPGVTRLIAAVAILMVGLAGWWLWPVNKASPPSIVVVPFADLSSGVDRDNLADGLSEQLILVLSQIPGPRVASQTSSFYFTHNPADVATIGRELGVEYALEGSVRRQEDTVRVAARLVDIDEEATLFAETLEGRVEGLLDVQSRLALRIASALAVTLPQGAVKLAASGGTTNKAAYALYVRGLGLRRRDNAEDLLQAEELLRGAIALDPSFVQAYIELSVIYIMAGARTGRFEDYYQKRVALQRNLDLAVPGGERPVQPTIFGPAAELGITVLAPLMSSGRPPNL